MGEARQGVHLGQVRFTLDQGQRVFHKLVVYAVAFFIDPAAGQLLLGVGNLHQGDQLGLAGVLAVPDTALEADHAAIDAVDGIFHGCLTGHIGFLNIRLGSQMCAAALQQVQLDAADLGAGLLLDHLGQHGSQATQLGVAEAVGSGHLGLRHKAAVLIVDTLGHSHDAVALFSVYTLDILNELGHAEVHLGQIDQIGACAVFTGQGSGSGQPAGMAAHDLHHHDHTGVVHMGIQVYFHHGGGDILGGRAEAGAVVGAEQIVVDGLGYTHDPALVAHGLHVLIDLIAGIHGVVAAVIEEVADVVLLEHLQDAAIIGIVHLGVRDLVAAGAQGGGGGVLQQTQLLGILQTHVEQAIAENALDAVLRAQHLGDDAGFQGRVNDAVSAGVDHRRRPTGLTDDTGTL